MENHNNQQGLLRLRALHEIDRAITNNTDLTLTLYIILNHVFHQLEIDAALILLLDETKQHLVYAVGRGFGDEKIKRISIPIDEYPVNRPITNLLGEIYYQNPRGEKIFLNPSDFRLENYIYHLEKPLIVRGRIVGLLAVFHRTLINPDEEWQVFLDAITTQTAIAIDNAALVNQVQQNKIALSIAHEKTLEAWTFALEQRGIEGEEHIQKVVEMTLHLAWVMGINQAELIHIRRGALLHDIGKLGISDHILMKKDALTEQDWEVIKRHPQFARDMIKPLDFLKRSLDIPYAHHEKWDGTGYPRGLKGGEIPIAARIFAVVDVWDAMCSDRPYRPAWSRDEVKKYLMLQSGKHFDPQIVTKFFDLGMDRWNGHN